MLVVGVDVLCIALGVEYDFALDFPVTVGLNMAVAVTPDAANPYRIINNESLKPDTRCGHVRMISYARYFVRREMMASDSFQHHEPISRNETIDGIC